MTMQAAAKRVIGKSSSNLDEKSLSLERNISDECICLKAVNVAFTSRENYACLPLPCLFKSTTLARNMVSGHFALWSFRSQSFRLYQKPLGSIIEVTLPTFAPHKSYFAPGF